MRAKTAKKLRKFLELDITDDAFRERTWSESGLRYYGVIDGVHGNHRIEERMTYRLETSSDRQMYRMIKKIYKSKQPAHIYETLMEDLHNTLSNS